MPELWSFPTVSMGLGPLTSIYQARFNLYLHHRGLTETEDAKVWCFVGDGETDEPETLGSISLAARERLHDATIQKKLLACCASGDCAGRLRDV